MLATRSPALVVRVCCHLIHALLCWVAPSSGEHIPDDIVLRVSVLTADPLFRPENMMTKSVAAANLCTWAINIMEYNKIYRKVRVLLVASRVHAVTVATTAPVG